ncbi:uncharacterized protein BJ171DRAFT_601992 [Polychytrium aggregatum]|uniref:uncharacterized protein n=1 Tax=Polychytrium aggregatum TaxID=110093 RepID=UPI0022FE664A|nr:uncharacterized protein BJ171DRAFT_601992 [Polychytrium aggregatum]KAI9199210.1 hypothetical protein BJ171DRAFT_601992 [Polychytrium aggregatum]
MDASSHASFRPESPKPNPRIHWHHARQAWKAEALTAGLPEPDKPAYLFAPTYPELTHPIRRPDIPLKGPGLAFWSHPRRRAFLAAFPKPKPTRETWEVLSSRKPKSAPTLPDDCFVGRKPPRPIDQERIAKLSTPRPVHSRPDPPPAIPVKSRKDDEPWKPPGPEYWEHLSRPRRRRFEEIPSSMPPPKPARHISPETWDRLSHSNRRERIQSIVNIENGEHEPTELPAVDVEDDEPDAQIDLRTAKDGITANEPSDPFFWEKQGYEFPVLGHKERSLKPAHRNWANFSDLHSETWRHTILGRELLHSEYVLPDDQTFELVIYVSCNAIDTTLERSVLMSTLVPGLRAECRNFGIDLHFVDMRWGETTQFVCEHRLIEIYTKELLRCIKSSCGMSMLSIIGDMYGRCHFPIQMEQDLGDLLFDEIENMSRKASAGLTMLKKWFWLDRNTNPPRYVLQPITTYLPGFLMPSDQRLHKRSMWTWWNRCFTPIKEDLQHASRALRLRRQISKDVHQYFHASLIEKELQLWLQYAVGASPDPTDDYCRGVVINRRIENIIERDFNARFYMDTHGEDYDTLKPVKHNKLGIRCLELLMESIEPQLHVGDIFKRTVPWDSEGIVYDNPAHREYVDNMVQYVHDKAIQSIKSITEDSLRDPLCQEALVHLKHCRAKAADYIGHIDILERILHHLAPPFNHKSPPLFVSGIDGAGKSTVACRALQKLAVDAKHDESTPMIIVRFVGLTPESCTIASIIMSICRQITRAFATSLPRNAEESEAASYISYGRLKHCLKEHLKYATDENPIIIVIEGLHRLSESSDCSLTWLPMTLPKNARILLTGTTNHTSHLVFRDRLQTFPLQYQSINDCLIEVPNLTQEHGEKIVYSWLARENRRLRDTQYQTLQGSLISSIYSKENASTPFLLRFMYQFTRKWASHKFATTIPSKRKDLLDSICNQLEREHGVMLVSRTFALITAARDGLSQVELEDILSLDDDLLLELYRNQSFKLSVSRIPSILLAALIQNLDFLLTCQPCGELHHTPLLKWNHSCVQSFMRHRYLNTTRQRGNAYENLADYWIGMWSRGKPFDEDVLENSPIDLPEGRNIPSQPIRFFDGIKYRWNIRKIRELPRSLTYAHRWSELQELFSNLEFFDAINHSQGLHEIHRLLQWIIRDANTSPHFKISGECEQLIRQWATFFRIKSELFDFGASLPQLWDTEIANAPEGLFNSKNIRDTVRKSVAQTKARPYWLLRFLSAAWKPSIVQSTKRMTFRLPNVSVLGLCPSGKRLTGASSKSDCGFSWNVETGEEMWKLQHPTPQSKANKSSNGILWIQYLPSGNMLLTGNSARGTDVRPTICCWNSTTGILVSTLNEGNKGDLTKGHVEGSAIVSCAFIPSAEEGESDSVSMVSADSNGRIIAWDVSSGKIAAQGETMAPGYPPSVAISCNGIIAACTVAGIDWFKWDLHHIAATTGAISSPDRSAATVTPAAFSPDGTTLFTATPVGDKTLIHARDPYTRLVLWETTHAGLAQSIAVYPDGTCLASSSVGGFVYIWDLTSCIRSSSMKVSMPAPPLIHSFSLKEFCQCSIDSLGVLSANAFLNGLGKTFKPFVPAMKPLLPRGDDGSRTELRTAVIMPQPPFTMATASCTDGQVSVWNLDALSLAPRPAITALSFSDCGRYAVSLGGGGSASGAPATDQSIMIWEVDEAVTCYAWPVAAELAKKGSVALSVASVQFCQRRDAAEPSVVVVLMQGPQSYHIKIVGVDGTLELSTELRLLDLEAAREAKVVAATADGMLRTLAVLLWVPEYRIMRLVLLRIVSDKDTTPIAIKDVPMEALQPEHSYDLHWRYLDSTSVAQLSSDRLHEGWSASNPSGDNQRRSAAAVVDDTNNSLGSENEQRQLRRPRDSNSAAAAEPSHGDEQSIGPSVGPSQSNDPSGEPGLEGADRPQNVADLQPIDAQPPVQAFEEVIDLFDRRKCTAVLSWRIAGENDTRVSLADPQLPPAQVSLRIECREAASRLLVELQHESGDGIGYSIKTSGAPVDAALVQSDSRGEDMIVAVVDKHGMLAVHRCIDGRGSELIAATSIGVTVTGLSFGRARGVLGVYGCDGFLSLLCLSQPVSDSTIAVSAHLSSTGLRV